MGVKFSKTVSVYTNDPNHQKIVLRISGFGDKVVSLTPKDAKLNGLLGDEISTTVKIVPEKKYAFRIKSLNAANDKNISYDLKEIENSGLIEYLLKVTNISKEKGQYFDVITLNTDSKIKPVISIRVFGNILSSIGE